VNMRQQHLQRSRRSNYAVWLGLVILAVSATLATRYYPYFPGDVAVARWVQSLLPSNLHWAQKVSRTAEFPAVLLILAVIWACSWVLAGWRAGLLSILSLAGMLALGQWLGPVVARPRPAADLVQVFRPLTGFSCPSHFALRYAATFGFLAMLAVRKGSGWWRPLLLFLCLGCLAVGWVARVALGAHWPSDVLISYYLGLLWAAWLMRFSP
jgi:membrane-associated phospholipid phosphatase